MQEHLTEEGSTEPVRHCRRCRRKLKDPKSMKLGYGPICLKKHMEETG